MTAATPLHIGLGPEEYQSVVAPALHAAATLAAERGCASLFQDLPSMLALLVLTESLAQRYLDVMEPLGQCSPRENFNAAPLAAAVMAMSEMGATEDDMAVLVPALVQARLKLQDSGLLGEEQEGVDRAWAQLRASAPGQAQPPMLEAGRAVVRGVLEWEARESARGA